MSVLRVRVSGVPAAAASLSNQIAMMLRERGFTSILASPAYPNKTNADVRVYLTIDTRRRAMRRPAAAQEK